MKGSRNIAVFAAAAFMLTLSGSAFGYIDGGTGSMLVQVLLAGALGAVFFARNLFAKVTGVFARKPARNSKSDREAHTA